MTMPDIYKHSERIPNITKSRSPDSNIAQGAASSDSQGQRCSICVVCLFVVVVCCCGDGGGGGYGAGGGGGGGGAQKAGLKGAVHHTTC